MAAGHLCLLALDGAVPAGYSVCMRVLDELHILNIVVAPDFQRRGVGGWLLDETISRAGDLAHGPVLLEVRVSNAVARHLYLSKGFVEIGIRKDYYPSDGRREDAVVMCKERQVAV